MFGQQKLYLHVFGKILRKFDLAILKSEIFHCSDSFERGNQFNNISDRTNLQIYKKIKEPKYQTLPKQNKKCYVLC